jgi:hypothetical protein
MLRRLPDDCIIHVLRFLANDTQGLFAMKSATAGFFRSHIPISSRMIPLQFRPV